MSALTDKIAREHVIYRCTESDVNLQGVPIAVYIGHQCDCGWAGDSISAIAHIAQVTEAAVREQVARDIGRRRDEAGGQPTSATGIALRAYVDGAFNEAARIARGGAA